MKKLLLFISIFLLCLSSQLFSQKIVSISPNQASAGQTLNVTITGQNTHFVQNSFTTLILGFDQCSSTINSFTVNSPTSISANINVPYYSLDGYYDVGVYTSFDGYIYQEKFFKVNSAFPSVSASPASANPGQTLNVFITGTNTHFTQGSGTVSVDFAQLPCFPAFSSSNSFVYNDTYLEVHVTVPLSVDTGYYDMFISSEGWIYPNAFRVGTLTGVEEFENQNPVTVAPALFSSWFNVEINSNALNDAAIEIYDLFGRVVYKNSLAGRRSIQISKEDLQQKSNIYFVCILIDGRKYIRKVVGID